MSPRDSVDILWLHHYILWAERPDLLRVPYILSVLSENSQNKPASVFLILSIWRIIRLVFKNWFAFISDIVIMSCHHKIAIVIPLYSFRFIRTACANSQRVSKSSIRINYTLHYSSCTTELLSISFWFNFGCCVTRLTSVGSTLLAFPYFSSWSIDWVCLILLELFISFFSSSIRFTMLHVNISKYDQYQLAQL